MTPAETSVLSAVLDTGGKALEGLNLQPHHFTDKAGERIYQLSVELTDTGRPADAITMSTIAANDELLQRHGGAALIWKIMDVITPASAAPYHAKLVRQEAAHRDLNLIAQSMREQLAEGADVDQVIEAAKTDLENIGQDSGLTVEHIGDGMQDTLDELKQKPVFIETPWDDLNWIINGWAPGRLYIIGARPSVGKTVAGLQAALSLTNRGPVAYTSLEMNANELRKRMISHIAKVDMGRIMRHNLINDDWASIEAARHRLDNTPIYVDPSHEATFAQIARHAWSIKRQHGLSAVVVDYLGLIEGSPGQKEYEVVTEASRKLKLLAIALDVPVIALSQLNRGVESRDNKEPKISDLRSSGAIEQDADVIILLHRDLKDSPHELKMIVGKNRQGILGDAKFDFAGHYSEIRNQWQIPDGGF